MFDHGLLYGDGVFEGIRIYEGCVFKLEDHIERLEQSAKAILLDIKMSRQELIDAVCETCRQNGLSESVNIFEVIEKLILKKKGFSGLFCLGFELF